MFRAFVDFVIFLLSLPYNQKRVEFKTIKLITEPQLKKTDSH